MDKYMVDLFNISSDERWMEFVCTECEDRYGIEVRKIIRNIGNGDKAKWRPVRQFFKQHERCVTPFEIDGFKK